MQGEYRQRIINVDEEMRELPDEVWNGFLEKPEVFEKEIQAGRMRNTLKEFWWFVPTNSVIMLDESADLWNSKDFKSRPESLNTFINHHRHYKLDLFLFAQSREDLDVQLRRKFQSVYQVRNSLKENISDHWALNGFRWPFQFFFMRQYLASDIWGQLQKSKGNMVKPLEVHKVFPTRRGFQNYESFSAAGTLPGMKAASEDEESEDYEPSLWKRVSKSIPKLAGPFIFIVGCIGLLVGGYFTVMKGLHESTEALNNNKSGKKGTTSNENVASAENVLPGQKVDQVEPPKEEQEVEKVIFAGPGFFQTNKRRVSVGEVFQDGRVLIIHLDGFTYGSATNNTRIAFSDALSFYSESEPSAHRSGGDKQSLRNQRVVRSSLE